LSDELLETAEDAIEEAVTEAPAEAEATQNSATADKEPETLLSDDEGNGEGDANVVPEKYDFQPPEGYEVTPDVQVSLDEFSDIAKTAELTQSQYQALVAWQVDKGIAGGNDLQQQYVERVQGWAETAKNDTELGGEGFKANLAIANQAVEQFSTAGLKSIMQKPTDANPDGLGIGNHPELVRLFYRIGKAMGDSNLVAGGAAENLGDPLKRMYPSMYPDNS